MTFDAAGAQPIAGGILAGAEIFLYCYAPGSYIRV